MVEEVAQYSVRGGIFDIYGFGMAEPVRLEFIGDEIAELRHFDLLSQRSTRPAAVAVVLPVDGGPASEEVDDALDRASIGSLWPPDTIVVTPDGAHLEPELRRTWDEAQHHIELARRRGEDAPSREELYQPPEAALGALGSLGHDRRSRPQRVERRCGLPDPSAGPGRSRHRVDLAASCATVCRRSSCATTPASASDSMSCWPAGARRGRGRLAGHARRRRAGRRIPGAADRYRGRAPRTHRPRDLSARASHPSGPSLRRRHLARIDHRAQARRLRRASRARHRHLPRHRDDLRQGEHRRGGGGRIRGRRPAQCAALPHRPARAISGGERRRRGRAPRRGCTSSAASDGRNSATARARRSRK